MYMYNIMISYSTVLQCYIEQDTIAVQSFTFSKIVMYVLYTLSAQTQKKFPLLFKVADFYLYTVLYLETLPLIIV